MSTTVFYIVFFVIITILSLYFLGFFNNKKSNSNDDKKPTASNNLSRNIMINYTRNIMIIGFSIFFIAELLKNNKKSNNESNNESNSETTEQIKSEPIKTEPSEAEKKVMCLRMFGGVTPGESAFEQAQAECTANNSESACECMVILSR
jgi:large-conductance mechanosensitive channel